MEPIIQAIGKDTFASVFAVAIVFGAITTVVGSLCKLLAILFRGHPPAPVVSPVVVEEEDEDDEEEGSSEEIVVHRRPD